MTIQILRSQINDYQTYTLADEEMTLLKALIKIKATQDATLTFTAGCRASVCGTCAVRANGREVLSCAHKVRDGDMIEPLNYHPVLRDLKVDKQPAQKTLLNATAWLHRYQEAVLTHKDERFTERQTDCILCDACYSACPVFAVNPDFLGPFALTRAYRYSADKQESEVKSIVERVQHNGVWECTLCSGCTLVCPKGIDPKMDITMLRSLVVQHGYEDRTFAQMGFGTPDFGSEFGFDSNGEF